MFKVIDDDHGEGDDGYGDSDNHDHDYGESDNDSRVGDCYSDGNEARHDDVVNVSCGDSC
jgi:hypothetical protein